MSVHSWEDYDNIPIYFEIKFFKNIISKVHYVLGGGLLLFSKKNLL